MDPNLPNELKAAAVTRARDLGRAWPLALVFLVTFAIVCWIAPQKAGLAVWGISKLCLFAWAGYWVDRGTSTARPHELEGVARGAAEKRRSLIIAASIIAGGIGIA